MLAIHPVHFGRFLRSVARRIALRRALALRYMVDHLVWFDLGCFEALLFSSTASFTGTAALVACLLPKGTHSNEPDPGPRCDRRYDDGLRRSCVVFAWWCRCNSTCRRRRSNDSSKHDRYESHRFREHCKRSWSRNNEHCKRRSHNYCIGSFRCDDKRSHVSERCCQCNCCGRCNE